MIEYTTGDILRTDVEAIVNTVNCVGIMGRGIALQFKNAYPANFDAYAEACKVGDVQPGKMFVFDTGYLTNPKYIINFPTKRHWKGKSRLEDIQRGLEDLRTVIAERRIKSIAIPPLGAGLGGLDWGDVKHQIKQSLEGLSDVRVIVYEPAGAPSSKEMVRNRAVPTMSSGRAALVALVQQYINGLMDPCVSLLEVHKLMYFMQEAGQPLRLNYRKAHYGPYAENLRHVLIAVEGHLLTGYADGGDSPTKQLEVVPGAADDARKFLASDDVARARFERVVELVEGFETPYGLELLSTVHWVLKEGAQSLDEVVMAVHNWSERKQGFTPAQIELAYQTLQSKGWLDQSN